MFPCTCYALSDHGTIFNQESNYKKCLYSLHKAMFNLIKLDQLNCVIHVSRNE